LNPPPRKKRGVEKKGVGKRDHGVSLGRKTRKIKGGVCLWQEGVVQTGNKECRRRKKIISEKKKHSKHYKGQDIQVRNPPTGRWKKKE